MSPYTTNLPGSNPTGNATLDATNPPSHYLTTQPLLFQYVFFLALCTLETISFHLPIRMLLSTRPPSLLRGIIPYYPHRSLISTALLVSSFTKLFPLLLLIWNYDLPSSASAVSWAVIINNVAALEILLDCGYIRAGGLCAVGAVCRAVVGWVIHFLPKHASVIMAAANSCAGYSSSRGCRRRRGSRWSGRDWRLDRLVATTNREHGIFIVTAPSAIGMELPWHWLYLHGLRVNGYLVRSRPKGHLLRTGFCPARGLKELGRAQAASRQMPHAQFTDLIADGHALQTTLSCTSSTRKVLFYRFLSLLPPKRFVQNASSSKRHVNASAP